MYSPKRRMRGFTLIEIVIAMAVLSILAMLAMASYQHAVQKARRTEGKTYLQMVMAAEERYYGNFNRYTKDTGATGLGLPSESQPGHFYALGTLELSDDAQYLAATATPQDAQQGDACGNLILDTLGRRRVSSEGIPNCW